MSNFPCQGSGAEGIPLYSIPPHTRITPTAKSQYTASSLVARGNGTAHTKNQNTPYSNKTLAQLAGNQTAKALSRSLTLAGNGLCGAGARRPDVRTAPRNTAGDRRTDGRVAPDAR